VEEVEEEKNSTIINNYYYFLLLLLFLLPFVVCFVLHCVYPARTLFFGTNSSTARNSNVEKKELHIITARLTSGYLVS
jgi:hypothetical protein